MHFLFQLVKRLFFDISEEVDGDEDVSHFKNQVSDLKVCANCLSQDKRILFFLPDWCLGNKSCSSVPVLSLNFFTLEKNDGPWFVLKYNGK